MESNNVEFDFEETFFPRNTDEKLIKINEHKNIKEKLFEDHRKEMRKKTREREKKQKILRQEKIKEMTEGRLLLILEEKDKYYSELRDKNIKIDVNKIFI
jgi:hypothetical protein